ALLDISLSAIFPRAVIGVASPSHHGGLALSRARDTPKLRAIAPGPPLRTARRAADIRMGETFANQYPADLHSTDQKRCTQTAVVAVTGALRLLRRGGARHHSAPCHPARACRNQSGGKPRH